MSTINDPNELMIVKIVIKCIIVSGGNHVSINNLSKEFFESEGYEIPFMKFGFTSLLGLLLSMPNDIDVSSESFQNVLYLLFPYLCDINSFKYHSFFFYNSQF